MMLPCCFGSTLLLVARWLFSQAFFLCLSCHSRSALFHSSFTAHSQSSVLSFSSALSLSFSLSFLSSAELSHSLSRARARTAATKAKRRLRQQSWGPPRPIRRVLPTWSCPASVASVGRRTEHFFFPCRWTKHAYAAQQGGGRGRGRGGRGRGRGRGERSSGRTPGVDEAWGALTGPPSTDGTRTTARPAISVLFFFFPGRAHRRHRQRRPRTRVSD